MAWVEGDREGGGGEGCQSQNWCVHHRTSDVCPDSAQQGQIEWREDDEPRRRVETLDPSRLHLGALTRLCAACEATLTMTCASLTPPRTPTDAR